MYHHRSLTHITQSFCVLPDFIHRARRRRTDVNGRCRSALHITPMHYRHLSSRTATHATTVCALVSGSVAVLVWAHSSALSRTGLTRPRSQRLTSCPTSCPRRAARSARPTAPGCAVMHARACASRCTRAAARPSPPRPSSAVRAAGAAPQQRAARRRWCAHR